MSDTVATTNPNTNVMTPRLFLPQTVIRNHKVLHNQDLMTIIGEKLMLTMNDRTTFIRVCRLWRHVFYTRLIVNSPFQDSVRQAIFTHACIDACILFMQNVPKVSALTMKDIKLILKGTRQSTEIAKLLWQLPRESISPSLRVLYNLIASSVDFLTKSWWAEQPHPILDIACLVLQIDDVPRDNLTGLMKLLGPNQLSRLFSYILAEDPSRIHLMLPYVKIDVKDFLLYMHYCVNRVDLLFQFEAICRAFARDVYVDHYVRALSEMHGNSVISRWIDTYVRVGSELPNFAVELFKSASYVAGTAIKRFVIMGYVNPCSGTKYRFALAKANGCYMTIFQYASYIGSNGLCDHIVNDPRFKARDHLEILPFAIIRNRYMIAIKFLKEQSLDKEELEEGLGLVLEARDASRRKNLAPFDTVIKKIEKKLSMIGSRKKVKKDTK